MTYGVSTKRSGLQYFTQCRIILMLQQLNVYKRLTLYLGKQFIRYCYSKSIGWRNIGARVQGQGIPNFWKRPFARKSPGTYHHTIICLCSADDTVPLYSSFVLCQLLRFYLYVLSKYETCFHWHLMSEWIKSLVSGSIM